MEVLAVAALVVDLAAVVLAAAALRVVGNFNKNIYLDETKELITIIAEQQSN